MTQNNENNKKMIAEWLDWSSAEMKKFAEKTCDPTLKIKFEKMAGINREYRDKLGFFTDQKGNKQIAYEIEILKAAYFCQQAVFWRFCLWPLEENTAIVDEIVDAQKTIVRELYTEIKKRNSVM